MRALALHVHLTSPGSSLVAQSGFQATGTQKREAAGNCGRLAFVEGAEHRRGRASPQLPGRVC